MGLIHQLFRYLLFCALANFFCFTFVQAQESSAKDEVRVIDGKPFVIHTVLKKETLYSLSKQYDVTIEELSKFNPQLASEGLKAGQYLMIPRKAEVVTESKPTTAPPLLYAKPKKSTGDSAVIKPLVPDTLSVAIADTTRKNSALNVTYNVSLFLPLSLYAETAPPKEGEDAPAVESISPTSQMALEFYQGFRMATDSLVKSGLLANVSVYDMAGDTNRMPQLLQKPEIKKSNLLIGPATSTPAINKLAKYAKENNIVLISPMQNMDKILLDNPFVINCTPSVKTQCVQMSEYLVDSFATANIIILNASSQKDVELGNNFKTAITSLFKAKGNTTGKVRMISHADIGMKAVKEALSTTSKNLLIIPSSEEAFISVVLSNIKPLLSNNDITVCGLPTWQKFETIDADIFQQLNTHIFNAFYVNYNDENIINFRKNYRANYKTEPSEYVYQGFDAGYYYLKALMNFGTTFTEFLPELKYSVIHTTFDFEKKGLKGGFENTYISVLKYENFQLRKLNK